MHTRAALEIILKARDEASRTVQGAERSLGGLGRTLQSLGGIALGGLAMVGGAAAAAGTALAKMAIDAAPLETIQAAFRNVAEASGESADVMLAALQRGSAGMVAQRDLMETYNKAAMLVSETFANELPDAMGYLSKVAGATGQDMGFMLDSLVMGVGKLSSMILDNLGIQVDLNEAYTVYAERMGLVASEMSKEQQQAALMAQVMEKLAGNTAAVPDVLGMAAQRMAAFQATMKDWKDEVGLAVLPVLNTLMGTLGGLAREVLPLVTGFIEERVVPILDMAAFVFDEFIGSIGRGEPILQAIGLAFTEVLPDEVVGKIQEFTDGLQGLIDRAAPLVEMVVAWVGENVKLQDVLIALGVVIAAVVIPAIWGVIAAAAPLVAAAVGLIAVIALVRTAWEENWGGIQEKVAVVVAFLQGEWAKIVAFFQENMPLILETLERFKRGGGELAEFWQTVIVPALDNVWNMITTIVSTAVDVLLSLLKLAMEVITGDWEAAWETVKGIGTTIWEAMKALFAEFLEGVLNALGTNTEEFIAMWRNNFEMAQQIVEEVMGRIKDFIAGFSLVDVGRALIDGLRQGIEQAVGAVAEAAAAVVRAAIAAARAAMGASSPAREFIEIARYAMEGMQKGLDMFGKLPREALEGQMRHLIQPVGLPVPAMTGAGSGPVINVTLQFGRDSVRSDRDIEDIARRIEEIFVLRGVRTFEV